ncbi:LAFE_0D01376g1_1 [Lachancea fermentati]|uniref:GPI-anchored wall transfer protein n=1 Tax=Lachancea fermentati TaxID=4955 RepID=A0A1G4MAL4_LACFM|nr:LAFE_0D01376g1_1 [Lachancea fermentati]
MSALKQRKEEFVSGLTGGSIAEINAVTSVAVVGYLCWKFLHATAPTKDVNILVDFLLNWCALLLSITIYSDNPIGLNLLVGVPCFSYWLFARIRDNNSKKKSQEPLQYVLVKRPFITAYRGGMLIVTALAILAVDFNIFPRRFAKVETWGTSLMDLGVGSFVFSNGVVSSRSLLKESLTGKHMGPLSKTLQALRSGGTVLLLGLLRLYFVKNLEYQEHVTEYGVHWNFFITLSLLPFAMLIIDPLSRRIPRVVIAVFISFAYEFMMLFKSKFLEYLIASDRTNFISANREGIFSFLGYCSIFLWGQNTGFFILGNTMTKNNLYKPSTEIIKNKRKLSTWDKLTSVGPLTGLVSWSFICGVFLQAILSWHPYNVSRRFANLPYVTWVVTYNLGALTLYCLVDRFFENGKEPTKVPSTLEAMNSNGLILFLLANVSTGLVNMCIPTIDVSAHVGFCVILLYAFFLSVISILLLKRKIFIKL